MLTAKEDTAIRQSVKAMRKLLFKEVMLPLVDLVESWPSDYGVEEVRQIGEMCGHLRAAFALMKQFAKKEKFSSQIPPLPESTVEAEEKLWRIKNVLELQPPQ